MRSRKKKIKVFKKSIFKYVFLALLIAVCILTYSIFHGKYWDGKNNLNLVVGGETDVYILNLNPRDEEITKIIIPGNTELELARGLGVMKARNIWQLGLNEGLDGKLLTETLTKNIRLSAYAWGGKEMKAFWGDATMGGLIKAVLVKRNTNLSFGDRFKIALFSKSVKDYKRKEIDLSQLPFLLKSKLSDGEEGYTLSARFPNILNMIASDTRLTDSKLLFKIIDCMGKNGVAESMGKIIESLGAKITLIEDKEARALDCEIKTNNKEVGEFFEKTFYCKIGRKVDESNFDIEMILGSEFAERF